jgi:DNA-binding CsgD family transcriptional regulator
MKTNMSKVPVFRAIAGIAASTAIVCLLVEDGSDAFGPETIACALVALLSLAGAFVPASSARGLFTGPHPSGGEVLSLESFGLTRKEKTYVLESLAGKQIKEIASDQGVASSTVRTALSLAYKKLKVSGRAELLALNAYYRIE